MNIGTNIVLSVFLFVLCISCTEDSQIEIKQLLVIDNYKIVLFTKNVGATSEYSTNISIVSGKDKITNRDVGNVFIARGKKDMSISLKDKNIVIVHSFLDTDIFYKKNSYLDFTIVYDAEK